MWLQVEVKLSATGLNLMHLTAPECIFSHCLTRWAVLRFQHLTVPSSEPRSTYWESGEKQASVAVIVDTSKSPRTVSSVPAKESTISVRPWLVTNMMWTPVGSNLQLVKVGFKRPWHRWVLTERSESSKLNSRNGPLSSCARLYSRTHGTLATAINFPLGSNATSGRDLGPASIVSTAVHSGIFKSQKRTVLSNEPVTTWSLAGFISRETILKIRKDRNGSDWGVSKVKRGKKIKIRWQARVKITEIPRILGSFSKSKDFKTITGVWCHVLSEMMTNTYCSVCPSKYCRCLLSYRDRYRSVE